MSNHYDCSFKEGHDCVFKCPSCYGIPERHVFQCSRGHSICGACVDGKKLECCPNCHISYDEGKNRNLALEGILDGVQFQCPFKDAGCTAILGRAGIRKHRDKCPYKNVALRFCKLAGFPNCCQVMCIPDRSVDASPVIDHLTQVHEVEVKSLQKEEYSATILLPNFHELHFYRPSSSSSSLSTTSNTNVCTVSPTILTFDCAKLFIGPVFSDGYIAFICGVLESAHPEYQHYQPQVEFTIKSNQNKRDLKWTIPAPGIRESLESLECLMRFPVVELQKLYMRIEDKTLPVTVSYTPGSSPLTVALVSSVSREMQAAANRVMPYNLKKLRNKRISHVPRNIILPSPETPQHGSIENYNTLEVELKPTLVGVESVTQQDEDKNDGPPPPAVTIKQEVISDDESDSCYPPVLGNVAESPVPVRTGVRLSTRSTKGISSRYLNYC